MSILCTFLAMRNLRFYFVSFFILRNGLNLFNKAQDPALVQREYTEKIYI